MLKLLLLGATLLALAACQATYPRYPVGTYDTAAAFRRGQPSRVGTQVKPDFWGRHVVVKQDLTGTRAPVALDSIWGYARASGQAYRCVGHYVYAVQQVDTLAVYSRHVGKTTLYYCSQGLAGPLVLLRRRPVRQAFATNPAFTSLLEQTHLYRHLTAREPHAAGTRYRVVALYRQSLGPAAGSPP